MAGGRFPPLSVGPVGSPATIQNNGTAATDNAYLDVRVSGTAAGDPHVRFTIPSGTSWYAGVDNSASDVFIIGLGTAVGTTPIATFSGTTNGTIDLVGTSAVYKVGGTQVLAGGGASQVIVGTDNTKHLTFVTNGTASVQVNGTTGVWGWQEAMDISFGTATGTKLGTATTQKIGFWNKTPVVQYSTTGTSTGFTAGAGTTATHLSTFTGNNGSTAYTVGDIVNCLKLCGIMLV